MQMWDETTQQSIRNAWADLMIALVRAYPGKRTTMWTRIPDMMCSAARQTSRMGKWYTTTLLSLQIYRQGSAARPESLCSTWTARLAWFGSLPGEDTERRLLRFLQEERATLTAMAQERWATIKEQEKARGISQRSIADDTDEEDQTA